jgi:hypothetical protein
MPRPPTLKTTFEDLPADSDGQRETLLDCFGQHLFSIRNHLRDSVRFHVESSEARDKMGTIPARPYAAVAALDDEAKEAALQLSDEVIDRYMCRLLTLFQSTGSSLRLGDDHAIRYRLHSEVVSTQDDGVALEALINRDTSRALEMYFGRWLNRHREHR